MKDYDATIDDMVQEGWRIEQQTPTHTLLAKGNKTKHWAHILLTLATAGVWGIVYGLVLAFGGLKKRRVVRGQYDVPRVERVY